MLTFEGFAGINNVAPQERMDKTDLVSALNVDIGVSGDVSRRHGYSLFADGCHKNIFEAQGYLLSTADGGQLVAISADGTEVEIHPNIGTQRVWYTTLPDGRTAFSNGAISGITDGQGLTGWGTPLPSSLGEATDVVGGLFAGRYRWALSYVRTYDGHQGGAVSSEPFDITSGGILLTGLPALGGYGINVYLTDANGDTLSYAGTTFTDSFSYLGTAQGLGIPCQNLDMSPAPAGTLLATWQARALMAVGNVLFASRPYQPELFDLARDFKQFTSPITLVQPVTGGVYVGTETELAFLAGTQFDQLAYSKVLDAGVVKGSGVAVDGSQVKLGQGIGSGVAMVCLADKEVVAGFSGGSVYRLTSGRYQTDVAEVAATFRVINGTPQYLAVSL